jgi:hypothetical protein
MPAGANITSPSTSSGHVPVGVGSVGGGTSGTSPVESSPVPVVAGAPVVVVGSASVVAVVVDGSLDELVASSLVSDEPSDAHAGPRAAAIATQRREGAGRSTTAGYRAGPRAATGSTRAYARAGVREYWLVDPRARMVTVFGSLGDRFDRGRVYEDGETVESAVVPGLRIAVSELF